MSNGTGGSGSLKELGAKRSQKSQDGRSRQFTSVSTGGIVVTYGAWPRPLKVKQPEVPPRYSVAKRILEHRRSVDQAFHFVGLSTCAAWDILLDLYLAEEHNTRVSIKSACIASCVPATTALRWIKVLEEKSLIVRRSDPTDARRTFVALSEEARLKIGPLLDSL